MKKAAHKMREKWPKQMPLMFHILDHPKSRELEVISGIIDYAKQEGLEKGRKVRTDCTCVESNIHKPWDSTLLGDCVRVLTRLIGLLERNSFHAGYRYKVRSHRPSEFQLFLSWL
jgi:hypothetical protein